MLVRYLTSTSFAVLYIPGYLSTVMIKPEVSFCLFEHNAHAISVLCCFRFTSLHNNAFRMPPINRTQKRSKTVGGCPPNLIIGGLEPPCSAAPVNYGSSAR